MQLLRVAYLIPLVKYHDAGTAKTTEEILRPTQILQNLRRISWREELVPLMIPIDPSPRMGSIIPLLLKEVIGLEIFSSLFGT